jgi:hypothetical protein
VKRVIILSIGTATPIVVKALSETFGINHELLFKMLYNAPAIFLEDVDELLAQKANDLLVELGLEALIQNTSEAPPLPTEPVDIAVYITDPRNLTKVNKQLAEFLGCTDNDALQLLLNEPSVVLGGVSMATAESLQKRVDAEVIASNPKQDLYTLELTASDENSRLKLIHLLKNQGIIIPKGENKWVTNLTYDHLNKFLTHYRSQNNLKIYNQSYSRYRILLNEFDLNESSQTQFLIHQIGMPADALEEISANLPVIIDDSINFNQLREKLALYTQAGLNCSEERIPFGKYLISVTNITDSNKAEQLLNKFYKDVKLNTAAEVWKSPLPLESVLSRFLEKQLEYIGCEVEHEY